MNHVHVTYEGAPLADAAQGVLQRSGEQWTPMRAAVFDVLSGFTQPASAYDIAEAVSVREGRRIAANSVYRILNLFVSANLARRIESANAYLANAHPDCEHDCIFLVCDRCGMATHIDDDVFTQALRKASAQHGFTPARPVIEVRGSCEDCRKAG
ncbi:MAG: Fur family transcriptional regulator [Sphingomonadaceae bacterium]